MEDVHRRHKLSSVSRIAMLYLPDLLAPHQHRLLRDILHLSRCIQLPRGRLLQFGLVLREQHEPRCLGHGVQTCRGTFLWYPATVQQWLTMRSRPAVPLHS